MRRIYYMRIVVREYCGHDQSLPPILVAKSIRARLGIFTSNDWRQRAREAVHAMGFETNFNHAARAKCGEWDHIVFVYGSFDKEGRGRFGSSVWRIPAKRLDGLKAQTQWNELSREQTNAIRSAQRTF